MVLLHAEKGTAFYKNIDHPFDGFTNLMMDTLKFCNI